MAESQTLTPHRKLIKEVARRLDVTEKALFTAAIPGPANCSRAYNIYLREGRAPRSVVDFALDVISGKIKSL
ncbi:MAG: hypothetical protein G01um1014107_262 [Parcubacteria group bacterium Gr01-1014_107]|nr:MAG: hypothetical protein G01um1014107_262 [Parcubacteria group bacterium Gr01-1014_107]